MNPALVAASLALVAGATLGCSGEAPTDASTDDFCGTFNDFYTEVEEQGEEAQDEELVAALKDTGEELEEVGTPDDIPDDARAGFDLLVDTLAEMDDGASQEDVANLEDDYSEEEQRQSDAFGTYLNEKCGFEGEGDGGP